MRFGISTHLYHQERLSAAHLREMAEFGFTGSAVRLAGSLDTVRRPRTATLPPGCDAGLALHSVHLRSWKCGAAVGLPLRSRTPTRPRARAVAGRWPCSSWRARCGCLPRHTHRRPRRGGTSKLERRRGRSQPEGNRAGSPRPRRPRGEIIPNALSTPRRWRVSWRTRRRGDEPSLRHLPDTGHAFCAAICQPSTRCRGAGLHVHDTAAPPTATSCRSRGIAGRPR